jgi:hypothetical protein
MGLGAIGADRVHAQTSPGFKDAAARAIRTRSAFRLAKIDDYNRRVDRKSRIKYKSFWLELPFEQKALDFVFEGLDEAQFHAVKNLYGNATLTQARSGRHDYNLVDFMPPAIQALNGHTFEYATADIPELNLGRNGANGTPEAPVEPHVTISANCWSTVYGILRSGGFGREGARPAPFTVFYTGRFQAMDFFGGLGKAIGSVNVKRGGRGQIPKQVQIETGDLILIITARQLYTGYAADREGNMIEGKEASTLVSMEHAAIHIDDGLVFEKSNGGSDDPYRFMPLAPALEQYTREVPTRIQIRRFHGELPDPRDVFGGTGYAIEERYKRPIPKPLQRLVLLDKEILFPQEGEYYNSWSGAVDVELKFDSHSGRYRLSPEAYEPATFNIIAKAEVAMAENSDCERRLIREK